MLNDKATKQQEPAPILVKAGDIAKALSVSVRQVGYWAHKGTIPCHKLGRKCVRFSLPEVLKALEIEIETANH
jgi:hypothetical protein